MLTLKGMPIHSCDKVPRKDVLYVIKQGERCPFCGKVIDDAQDE